MKKCVNCGCENDDGTELCTKCGSPLPKTEEEVLVSTKKEAFKNLLLSTRLFKITLIVFIVAIIAIVFFVFQLLTLGFDKTIFFADVIMIVFFSVVALLAVLIFVLRMVIRIKRNKK